MLSVGGRARPNKAVAPTALIVAFWQADAVQGAAAPRAFGSETQQNLSTAAGRPNLIVSGLYWSQNRQDLVKICHLQWCILDSERGWFCITLAMEGTDARFRPLRT